MAVTRRTAAEVGAQSPAQPLRSKAINPQNEPRGTLTTLSADEIATHDTSEDLWVIVRNKVRRLPASVHAHRLWIHVALKLHGGQHWHWVQSLISCKILPITGL